MSTPDPKSELYWASYYLILVLFGGVVAAAIDSKTVSMAYFAATLPGSILTVGVGVLLIPGGIILNPHLLYFMGGLLNSAVLFSIAWYLFNSRNRRARGDSEAQSVDGDKSESQE